MKRYIKRFKENESIDWDSLEESLSYPREQKIQSIAVFSSSGLGRIDERHMIALLTAKGNVKMFIYDGKSISFKDSNNSYIEARKDNFLGWSLDESNDESNFIIYHKGYAVIIAYK